MNPAVLCFLFLLGGCDAWRTTGSVFTTEDFKQASALYMRASHGDLQAFEGLESSIDAKKPSEAFFAGLLFDPAVSVVSDAQRSYEFYVYASRTLPVAQHNLGLLLLNYRPSESQEAIALLEKSAGSGCLESMLLLAMVYESGYAQVKANQPLALDWYQRAVEQFKYPPAEYKIGVAYRDGMFRPHDTEKAVLYLTSAAKAGFSKAQHALASVSTDPQLVAQWKQVAAFTDRQYAAEASRALSSFEPYVQDEIRRAATAWVRTHSSPDRAWTAVDPTRPITTL